jgi:hypothetical protein
MALLIALDASPQTRPIAILLGPQIVHPPLDEATRSSGASAGQFANWLSSNISQESQSQGRSDESKTKPLYLLLVCRLLSKLSTAWPKFRKYP